LVQKFNQELRDIKNAAQHIGPLDLEKVKGKGIEYDNLWDIDRMRSQEDWAAYEYVRRGIEAVHILKRTAEVWALS
jgi:hypothetical protein